MLYWVIRTENCVSCYCVIVGAEKMGEFTAGMFILILFEQKKSKVTYIVFIKCAKFFMRELFTVIS